MPNNEIIPSDYKLYRCDRDDGRVMVASLSDISVRSQINSQPIQCSASCEICAVKLHLTESQPLIIIGTYRHHPIETHSMHRIYVMLSLIYQLETLTHLFVVQEILISQTLTGTLNQYLDTDIH